jgi:hypothetical protein
MPHSCPSPLRLAFSSRERHLQINPNLSHSPPVPDRQSTTAPGSPTAIKSPAPTTHRLLSTPDGFEVASTARGVKLDLDEDIAQAIRTSPKPSLSPTGRYLLYNTDAHIMSVYDLHTDTSHTVHAMHGESRTRFIASYWLSDAHFVLIREGDICLGMGCDTGSLCEDEVVLIDGFYFDVKGTLSTQRIIAAQRMPHISCSSDTLCQATGMRLDGHTLHYMVPPVGEKPSASGVTLEPYEVIIPEPDRGA